MFYIITQDCVFIDYRITTLSLHGIIELAKRLDLPIVYTDVKLMREVA